MSKLSAEQARELVEKDTQEKKTLPEIAEDIRVELQGIRVLLAKFVALLESDRQETGYERERRKNY